MITTTSRRPRGRHASLLAVFLGSIAVWAGMTGGASPEIIAVRPPEKAVEQDPGSTVASRRVDLGSSPTSAWFGPAVGTRLVFDYSLDLRFAPDVARDPRGDTFSYSADLIFDVIHRDDESITFAAVFDDARITKRGLEPMTEEELRVERDALAAGAYVELDRSGTILSYRFVESLSAEQRNLLRMLLATFEFHAPEEGAGTWEELAADGTGRYLARYEVLEDDGRSIRIGREKVRYEVFAGSTDRVPQHRLEGGGLAVLDREVGWLRGAEVDESLALIMGGREANVRVRGRMTLRDTATVQRRPLEASQRVAASMRRVSVAEGMPLSEEERRAILLAGLEGLSFEAVTRELVERVQGGGFDSPEVSRAWFDLTRFLDADPALAERIGELVAGGSAQGDAAGLLLSALGAAGNAQCQTALLDVYRDELLPDALREAAVIAASQLDAPASELVDALGRRLEAATSIEDVEATTMLTLGTLSSRGATMLDGRSTLDLLLTLEDRARALGAVDAWLDSLGNSGSERIVDKAVDYLHSGDESVRFSAVSALRTQAADPRAISGLEECARNDPSDRIRERSVRVLARGGTERGLGVVREALRDPAERVRQRAVVALGSLSKRPESLEALRHVAAEDPSSGIRALAGKILE